MLALLVLVGCAQDPPRTARNIVVILTDDQRYDAMGFLNPFFETPRIDQLAAGGVLFENAFVTTSVCGPSRASILTGQWSFRHGVLRNGAITGPASPTFPQLLHAAGYETAFIGKWHLGEVDAPRAGFDHWASYPGQGKYVNQPFNVDGKTIETNGHNADVTTDLAVDFLNRKHSKPFMLFVSHKAVHGPFRPAERHEGSFGGREWPRPATMGETADNDGGKPHWVEAQRHSWIGVAGRYPRWGEFDEFARRYAETVRTIDDSVGRIVDTLQQLGLFDSTLIVFTSDNGYMMGEHGLIGKRAMYEESIRVPMVVSCPELFAGGQHRSQIALNVDLCPTLLDVAGVAVPMDVQGRSLLPLLKSDSAPWRDAFVYTYLWESWFPQTPSMVGLRTDRYKLVRYLGVFDRMELYDLEADPEEERNLIGDYFRPSDRATTRDLLYRSDTPQELRDLFVHLDQRLDAELEQLGYQEANGHSVAHSEGDDSD